jgi:hypothetical protein
MDGCILDVQLCGDMSIAETIEALILQHGFSQIEYCALCIGGPDH